MKVVIIGSGNVATVLSKKIAAAGNEILQVVSRSLLNAKRISSLFNAAAADNLMEINTDCDIYIIAVADSAIEEVAQKLHLRNKLVVHTAGSVSKEVLKGTGAAYGILYPLQTLRKEMEALPQIPVVVDGNNQLVTEALINFAFPWAKNVWQYDDEQRRKLHIAAVMVSNFTNHLFDLTDKYCELEVLNFNMLLPLIKETVQRIERFSPVNVQTGPAVREDLATIEKHRELLNEYPRLEKVYTMLSQSIIDFKNGGDL